MRAPETATREVQKEQCIDPEAVSGANRPCKSGVRKRTLACTKTLTQSVPASAKTIGLNHEIAILAEVVMKTRQYLQTNCNGVLQCNDVSK